MRQHLAAFYSNQSAGASYSSLASVVDSILSRTSSSNYLLPEPAKLKWACLLGASTTRGRVNTPQFRTIGLPAIFPVERNATPSDVPNICDWFDYPLSINAADEFGVDASNDAAGAVDAYAFCFLDFGSRSAPQGPCYTLRATASITAVANTWTTGTMSFDQNLPSGEYSVIGMSAIGTNLAAARLAFAGGTYRPGVLAQTAIANHPGDYGRFGKLGLFGVFTNVNIPNLEILAVGANSSQEVYLDVVKTR